MDPLGSVEFFRFTLPVGTVEVPVEEAVRILRAARGEALPLLDQYTLLSARNEAIRSALARHEFTLSQDVQSHLAHDRSSSVLCDLVGNRRISELTQRYLAKRVLLSSEDNSTARKRFLENPSLTFDLQRQIFDAAPESRPFLATNPALTPGVQESVFETGDGAVISYLAGNPAASPDLQRRIVRLAASWDEAVRDEVDWSLAANPSLAPDLQLALSLHDTHTVRTALAANPALDSSMVAVSFLWEFLREDLMVALDDSGAGEWSDVAESWTRTFPDLVFASRAVLPT